MSPLSTLNRSSFHHWTLMMCWCFNLLTQLQKNMPEGTRSFQSFQPDTRQVVASLQLAKPLHRHVLTLAGYQHRIRANKWTGKTWGNIIIGTLSPIDAYICIRASCRWRLFLFFECNSSQNLFLIGTWGTQNSSRMVGFHDSGNNSVSQRDTLSPEEGSRFVKVLLT